MSPDPFSGFDLERQILRQAIACGVRLHEQAVLELAAHARAVLRANERLHLTAIVEPRSFVERHLGESFAGASLLAPGTEGLLVDLGSGNGYPGLPLAAARPLLEPVLVEASTRKARFLRSLLNDVFRRGSVIAGQVQRAADLESAEPVRVLTCRAAGGWERILPRLAPALAEDGVILLWAGEAEKVLGRRSWSKLRVVERRSLPGRDRAWVWCLASA